MAVLKGLCTKAAEGTQKLHGEQPSA
jgi:hypothetical protein